MIIFRDLNEIIISSDTSVTIGTFDGIHIGHMEVILSMKKMAKTLGTKTFVYTFENNPLEFLYPETAPKRVMDIEEKIDVFNQIGVDYLLILKYDQTHKEMASRDFVEKIILNKIKAKSITVGDDFTFGSDEQSDIKGLIDYGNEFNFNVSVIPAVEHEGVRISSTIIRSFLKEGRTEDAAKLLGRPHFLMGKVIHGAKRGRKLGIPTLNLEVKKSHLALKRGVYFTNCIIDGKEYNAMTNVGLNPTFGKGSQIFVETHAIGLAEDVYSSNIKIEFLKWHRAENKFETPEKLKSALNRDLQAALKYFDSFTKTTDSDNL